MSFEVKVTFVGFILALALAQTEANSVASLLMSPISLMGETDVETKPAKPSLRELEKSTSSPSAQTTNVASVGIDGIREERVEPKKKTKASNNTSEDRVQSSDNRFKSQKFSEYIRPICNSVDRLGGSQIYRIQIQLKTLLEKSGGKLSYCFIDNFGFDPRYKPTSIEDLVNICPTKHTPLETKPQYRAFLKCAATNWSDDLDEVLLTILGNRQIGASHHRHVENDPNLDAIMHDNDDIQLIESIVNRVMLDGESLKGDSEFKVIDVNDREPLGMKPQPIAPSDSRVIVWINDTEGANSDIPSSHDLTLEDLTPVAARSTITMSPLEANPTAVGPITSTASTSPSNHFSPQLLRLVESGPQSSLTASPNSNISTISNTSATELVAEGPHSTVELTSQKFDSNSSTPQLSIKIEARSTTLPPTVKSSETKTVSLVEPDIRSKKLILEKSSTPIRTTLSPSKSTTERPFLDKSLSETIEKLMLQHEIERAEMEKRFQAEKDKLLNLELQESQGNPTFQAIRSLQSQKKLKNDHQAGSNLHKMEHERQMVSLDLLNLSYNNLDFTTNHLAQSLDPIRHMTKHLQYDIKQREKAEKSVVEIS